MDEAGSWKLSPAYDLTFSSGPGGEQSTMVLGEGKYPSKYLIELGKKAKLPKELIQDVIHQTKHALSRWERLAVEYHVADLNIKQIQNSIN